MGLVHLLPLLHCAADQKIDIRYSIALLIERLVGLCIHALGIAEDNFQLTIIAFGGKAGVFGNKKLAVISGGAGSIVQKIQKVQETQKMQEIQKMIMTIFRAGLTDRT